MRYLKEHTDNEVLVFEFLVQSVLDPLTVQSVLAELIQNQQSYGRSQVVIDFSNVQMISAGMLGALLSFRSKALFRGFSVKLSGLDSVLAQIFTATTLEGLFDIHRTEQDAVKSFAQELSLCCVA